MIRSILDALSWALGFGPQYELDCARTKRYLAQRELDEAQRRNDQRRKHQAAHALIRATNDQLRLEAAAQRKRSPAKLTTALRGSQ